MFGVSRRVGYYRRESLREGLKGGSEGGKRGREGGEERKRVN